MKGELSGHTAVHAALRRLEQYSTLSPFARLFYRLVYEQLDSLGMEMLRLEKAFHLILRCECRKHQAVARVVHHGKLDVLKVVRIGRAMRGTLRRLCRAIEVMETDGYNEAVIRELLLVTCHYHLGNTDKVICGLRRVIEMGCHHALVHFALGYHLYCSAFQRFTRLWHAQALLERGTWHGEIAAEDRIGFESTCVDAMDAFKQGLCGSKFDAQLLWWIGTISEVVGDRAGARRAFIKAAHADPEGFATLVEKKLLDHCATLKQSLGVPHAAMRSPAEQARLSKLAPITDAEIGKAREFLAETNLFPEFFGER